MIAIGARGTRFLTGMGFDRQSTGQGITIQTAVHDHVVFIPTPLMVFGLAKTGVGQDHYQAPTGFHRMGAAFKHFIQGVEILGRQNHRSMIT